MTREEQEKIIYENVPKVYEAGRGSIKNEVANALKGSASGEVVALKDVSPLEHGLGVRVSSKNLLDLSPIIGKKVEANGASIICNADGSITASGTPTGYISFSSFRIDVPRNVDLVFSASGTFTNINATISTYNDKNEIIKSFSVSDAYEKININMAYDVAYVIIDIKRRANDIEMSGTAYFQLKKGKTTTAYTPFVPDVGAVKLRVQRTNVLDTTNAPMFGTYSPSINRGWEYEKTSTGFRCLCGAGANIGSSRLGYQSLPLESLRGKTLTVSFKRYSTLDDTNTNACCAIQAGDNEFDNGYTYVVNALSNRVTYGEAYLKDAINGYFKCTFTVPKDETRKNLFVALYLGSNAVAAKDSVVEYSDIQLEIDGATEYEPYIEPVEYAVSADGTVEGVKSIYPATTLTTDTVGALIEVDYNRDINKAFEELHKVILSLGGIL